MEANSHETLKDAALATKKFLESAIINGKVTAQSICDLSNIVNRALTAPPRNCDRFGGDYKMLHTAWFDWTGSPSGQNPDGTAKMGFGEWLLAPIDARFVKCENLPRPATEAEVDSGEAKWCAACAADCPDTGKDCLVVCKQFKEAKA